MQRLGTGGDGKEQKNMKTKCNFRTELLRVKLAQTRYGRVLLHLGCLTMRPSHFSWHWHGILRELSCAH